MDPTKLWLSRKNLNFKMVKHICEVTLWPYAAASSRCSCRAAASRNPPAARRGGRPSRAARRSAPRRVAAPARTPPSAPRRLRSPSRPPRPSPAARSRRRRRRGACWRPWRSTRPSPLRCRWPSSKCERRVAAYEFPTMDRLVRTCSVAVGRVVHAP